MPDAELVAGLIRDIPDFPKPGIVFKDVTPVFADPDGLRAAVDCVVGHATDVGATHIVSAEARGFVLGGAAAAAAGLGFVLGRKPGKLPRETVAVEYELEYGTDVLEVHADALPGGRPGAGARRPPGHRRHRQRALRAGRAGRGGGRGVLVPDRAGASSAAATG